MLIGYLRLGKLFLNKLKEAFLSVAPITAVIFVMTLFFIPTDSSLIINLAISALLILIGIALFSLGADNSMIELGSGVGSTLSKKNKLLFSLVCGFIIGFVITLAEPDLMVLAKQVSQSSSLSSEAIFLITVSAGVGIMFLLSIARVVFRIKLSTLLSIAYSIVFVLVIFAPNAFMPIAFDSGSVTTGAISVPFLIAFGLGFSAVRSGDSQENSFGLIGLCSVGPIISVMILSLFIDASSAQVATQASLQNINFFQTLLDSAKEVAVVLIPIIAILILFQIFSFHYPKTKIVRMIVGLVYTYVGIVLFLTGVECGFLPIAGHIGSFLYSLENNWIAIPIGFLLGALAIIAEPALQILKKQVEDITSGAIKQKVIIITISLGVALSVATAVTIALYPINLLYILFPVYVLSIILAFINTQLFSAVAFDSGGVATGPMAVAFTLPLVSNISSIGNGFGTVALIAAFPILTMQILGFVYRVKLYKVTKEMNKIRYQNKTEIIEFDLNKVEEKVSKKEIAIIDFVTQKK